MKNKIEDLRNVLFETLEDLRDKEKPMEIERAKAIAGVAQVIVDSAKAENDFIKLTGKSSGSGFIPKQSPTAAAPALESGPQTRILPAGNGNGHGDRIDLSRCPDPNCGGRLAPKTNGNGSLVDACDKCHRTVTPALTA